ncbi:hypothetical protein GCM10010937_10830 [Gluconobacter japonicus]|uniref:Uncharacterized protein n=1 Tax=Gluconobacter japonicus TaxID=376620 RepID=A0ABQ5WH18_GLUJA|nr:hypothetical protein AD938_11225 [Gluconobacter japonicus]GBR26259.1 hypothetical protein AA3271_2250 [Gluconobacter japonicus NBRC 3271]GLQ59280.1 hypothetical protein GCM10010937_10830 [Gluconobacter japonicus]
MIAVTTGVPAATVFTTVVHQMTGMAPLRVMEKLKQSLPAMQVLGKAPEATRAAVASSLL